MALSFVAFVPASIKFAKTWPQRSLSSSSSSSQISSPFVLIFNLFTFCLGSYIFHIAFRCYHYLDVLASLPLIPSSSSPICFEKPFFSFELLILSIFRLGYIGASTLAFMVGEAFIVSHCQNQVLFPTISFSSFIMSSPPSSSSLSPLVVLFFRHCVLMVDFLLS